MLPGEELRVKIIDVRPLASSQLPVSSSCSTVVSPWSVLLNMTLQTPPITFRVAGPQVVNARVQTSLPANDTIDHPACSLGLRTTRRACSNSQMLHDYRVISSVISAPTTLDEMEIPARSILTIISNYRQPSQGSTIGPFNHGTLARGCFSTQSRFTPSDNLLKGARPTTAYGKLDSTPYERGNSQRLRFTWGQGLQERDLTGFLKELHLAPGPGGFLC